MVCTLQIVCDCTKPGDDVRAVGDSAALGYWDGSRGAVLRTTAQTFPRWTCQAPPLEGGSEFKFIIVHPSGGVTWEPFAGNRKWPFEQLRAGDVVEARFGHASIHIERAAGGPAATGPQAAGCGSERTGPHAAAASTPGSAHSVPAELRALAPKVAIVVPEDVPEVPECPAETCRARISTESTTATGAPSELSPNGNRNCRTPVSRSETPMSRTLTPGSVTRKISKDVLESIAKGEGSNPRLRRTRTRRLIHCERRKSSADAPCHQQFIFDNRGRIHDHYETDKTMGQGSFGSVCKARSKLTSDRYAIKTIKKVRLGDIPKFKEEIEIMKIMDHPNVIKLFEHYEDDDNIYLVMDLCSGGDLFDHIIAHHNFTETTAALVMQQILRGLFYIHERGVCHRDIKPENFLFTSDTAINETTLKIIDFGLSRRVAPGEVLRTKVGTPVYVAPEVLRGEYTIAADIWSSGVLLYIMLSGSPPFHGTDMQILRMAKAGHWSFDAIIWHKISEGAKGLVRSLMHFSPAARLTAEQALQNPWVASAVDIGSPAGGHRVVLGPDLLEGLIAYKSKNALKKAALQMIAWRFISHDQIKEIEDAFKTLDANGDGFLTLDELREGLEQGGQDLPEDLQQIVSSVDADGNGKINYTEFIAATLDSKADLLQDAVRSVFYTFDKDGDGFISPEELLELMDPTADGEHSPTMLQCVEELTFKYDINGDGQIDLVEFETMMSA